MFSFLPPKQDFPIILKITDAHCFAPTVKLFQNLRPVSFLILYDPLKINPVAMRISSLLNVFSSQC